MKKGQTKVEVVNGAFKMELTPGLSKPAFVIHTSKWHSFSLEELEVVAAEITETVEAFKI